MDKYLKLIEKKYLYAFFLFLFLTAIVQMFYVSGQKERVDAANRDLKTQTQALAQTKEEVNAVKGSGTTSMAAVVKETESYESFVTPNVDDLLFNQSLSEIAKGAKVVISPPIRGSVVTVNDKGISYIPYTFDVSGDYTTIRGFLAQCQGAASYLITVGETSFSFTSDKPFNSKITANVTLRAWIDLSDRLISKGTSSRESGLEGNGSVADPLAPNVDPTAPAKP